MISKVNNKGLSIFELIIVMAILGILVGTITPTMIKYIERARKVKIEKEASEVMRSAQVALVEVTSQGNEPKSDSIKNKVKNTSSPYYKGGRLYGNISNYSVHDGFKSNKNFSNVPFGKEFLSVLGITYGAEWKSGSSSIPVSEKQPKINPAGSMTKECIFLVFYDAEGNMIVEYSREGYFVRMENSILIDSIKITDTSKALFTQFN